MDWRVFIIGPMRDQSGPGGGPRPGPDNHLAWLRSAVVAQLVREGYSRLDAQDYELSGGSVVDSTVLERETDRIVVITPIELYGPRDIPTNVFDAIDESDLVIADLSGARPAVVYELAFAHALGISTILVREGSDDVFYLRQQRTADPDFTGDPTAESALTPHLRGWLRSRDKKFNAHNPMTDFYGAPLPDISAAAGLAVGYVDSFLRPVLAPDARIVRRGEVESSPVAGVLVLHPGDFTLKVAAMTDRLTQALAAAGPDVTPETGAINEVHLQTGAGPRVPFFVAGGWVIDIPRTALTLVMSRRMQRSTRDADPEAPGGAMAQALMERFFETTKALLRSERSVDLGSRRHRYFYGSAAEIVDAVRSDGRSRSVWE